MKTKLLILTVIFCLSISLANAQFTKIYDFNGVTSGQYPEGDLISDGTFLYGVTSAGGVSSQGTIFKILPDGTSYQKLFDFTGANGSGPAGTLLYDGTYLYGTTKFGGATGIYGTIFKIKPDGTGFTQLLDFNTTSYKWPNKTLVTDGTFLYGTFYTGGPGVGNIFKIKLDGTGFALVYNFNGLDGEHPMALIYDGTFLYGMCYTGGVNGIGTVFKVMPDGTGFVKLLDFAGASNGKHPQGSLFYDGAFLYGMTKSGGISDLGSMFKIMPNGTGYVKLLDFTGVNGNRPYGTLISDGVFLYGMTNIGGANNYGTIFKIMPDGTSYYRMFDFDGSVSGIEPFGSLFYDGSFLYGIANAGGANSLGTIFKTGLSTSIGETNIESEIAIYPNPSNGIFTINTNATPISHIEIYNVLGEIVYQSAFADAKLEIDLGSQSKGVYFVQIVDENNSISNKKIIIQ